MKIAVLGAGPSQCPLIQRALQGDAMVFAIDGAESPPGFQLGVQALRIDLRDIDGIEKAIRSECISSVISIGTELGLRALAELGRRGVPANVPPSTILEMGMNKALFRSWLSSLGLPSVKYVVATASSSADDIYSEFDPEPPSGKVMVKPVDSWGSIGASIVELRGGTKVGVDRALGRALQCSPSGVVVVEEFLDGAECGGDARVVAGSLKEIVVTQKLKTRTAWQPKGHLLVRQAGSQTTIESSIAEVLERLVAAVADRWTGFLNFDCIVGQDEVAVMLEISGRLGGNGISLLAQELRVADFLGDALSDIGVETPPPSSMRVPHDSGGMCSLALTGAELGRLLALGHRRLEEQGLTLDRVYLPSQGAVNRSMVSVGGGLATLGLSSGGVDGVVDIVERLEAH